MQVHRSTLPRPRRVCITALTPHVRRTPLCPLCRQRTDALFWTYDYRRPQDRTLYPVVWCTPCQHGQVDAALSPEQVAQFYEVAHYTHGADGRAAVDPAETAPGLRARIRTHLAWRADRSTPFKPDELGVARGRLIDLGCGSGVNMARFKKAGFDVAGVEPDPRARQLAGEVGPIWAGTAEEPPADLSGGYHVALMCHSLQHTITPLKALQTAHRLLAPGGTLVVEVPNCEAVGFTTWGPVWPWADVPRHLHFFTQASLTQALQQAGFEVTRVYWDGYVRQFSPGWIADMDRIQQALRTASGGASPVTVWRAWMGWKLLARTARAAPQHKYDSVRVHAIKRV